MGKRGPKAWQPTDDQIEKIKLYAGLGSTQKQVAIMLGVSEDTLVRQPQAKAAFEHGKAITITKVAGSLVKNAMLGDFRSQQLYLTAQAGWCAKNDLNIISEDGSMSPRLLSNAIIAALERKHRDG